MASCPHREMRRSLPVVHRSFMGHRGQSDDQYLCQCDERVFRGGCLGKLGHVRQLIAVMADVGDLVGHDQGVLGIDHGLHVVADDARVPAAGGHRSRIRISQRDLAVLG